jgi:predicted transcriptional regulator
MTESEVRDKVAKRIQEAGSLRSLAKELKVSPALLSDFMNGRRKPGPKMLKPLGLKMIKITTYEMATHPWEAIS